MSQRTSHFTSRFRTSWKTNADSCFKFLDFKCTHANNGLYGHACCLIRPRVTFNPGGFSAKQAPSSHDPCCPSLELNPSGLMLNSFCKILCVCGLMGMLWPDHAVSQTTALPSVAPQRAPNASSPPDSFTRYAPLGQVLPRATQESGVQFQAADPMLKEEVPVSESGPHRNLNLELVLDEFSRIELYGDDSELQKVILLNRNTGARSQAPTASTRSIRKPVKPALRKSITRSQSPSPSLPTTKLSSEQLQTLIRGAYRSPLPEKLWDDPEYREFLVGQGVSSREEMKDRNKAKNIRKTVRRLLWQIKNKSGR